MIYFEQFNYVRMGGLEGFKNRVQSALIYEVNKSKIRSLSQSYLNGAKCHAKFYTFYSTYSPEFNAE